MRKAEVALMPNCILAEGCVWNRNEAVLYFTDIDGRTVYRWNPVDQRADTIRTEERAGCLVFHKDGGIVTAERSSLIHNDTKGRTLLFDLHLPDHLRFNDGKCDRFGNLWVGTMAVSQAHPAAKHGGSLYCIKDGKVAAEYGGYTIPNGLAWNRDGSVFYHIDTALNRVDAYEVEEETRLINRRTVLAIPETEGSPDGMCMDEEGNLWIAMWGGGKVSAYHLPSGEKIEEIQVADRYASCCCFGGKNGKELYITTARDEDGTGGQLYRADVPVGGAAVYKYGGGEV